MTAELSLIKCDKENIFWWINCFINQSDTAVLVVCARPVGPVPGHQEQEKLQNLTVTLTNT